MDRIATFTLSNGLVLLVERIESAASVAMHWLSPLGSATDPPDADGLATMLSEMIFRGAGGLSSREHSDALDRLGVERDSRVTTHHLHLTAVLLGRRLESALPLIVNMMRRPALPADALAPVRSLALQSLDSLEDDPQHLVMLRLRERHMAEPFNRHGYGQRPALERATIDELRQAWMTRNVPAGTIIGVAGAVNPAWLAQQFEQQLREWSGRHAEPATLAPPRRGCLHLPQPTQQVHIGLAWDAPRAADPAHIVELLAVNVLSGSTSARLFTEVRQKRSLCYSIDAHYSAGRDTGAVMLYAGTTPERAQETLDVAMEQLRALRRGATAAEFHRAVIGLKSSLVMSGESTSARAGALASDFFRLGRARSLDEIAAEVDAVSLDALNDYLAARSLGPFTLACIGPKALTMPS